MRYKPQHTCLPSKTSCAGCAFELGVQTANKKKNASAKFVWMVVGSDNPCDIRRYAFSHAEGVAQLSHVKKGQHKDYTGGVWKLFKLVPVNRTKVN